MEALVDNSRRRGCRRPLGGRCGLVAEASEIMRPLVRLRRAISKDQLEAAAVGVVVVLSLWLLLSCVVKVQDHGAFILTVESHGLLHPDWVRGLGITFIAIEGMVSTFALALAMLSRSTASLASMLIAGFFTALAVYAAILVAFPPATPVSCGCGVGDVVGVNWTLIAFQNAGVALLASMCGVWLSWSQTTISPTQLAEHPDRSSSHTAQRI